MKTVFFTALLLATTAFGAVSPYSPELENRFKAIEAAGVGGALTDGYMIVGNGSAVATGVAMSGDATLANTGALTIGAGKVTEAQLKVIGTDGLHAKRYARATLNCAASGCSVGAHSLGVSLPANALITRSYIYVVTQLSDTGTCTVAISCEDANNIKTATDITGTAAGGFIEGASTGAASAFVGGIAATCAITATIADGGSCVPVAGKAIVFVEYNVVE
jgi:hypothetical protein